MSGVPSLRRATALILVSIPVAFELILGEVLFVGHIVFLVEVLGFAWGLVAFIAIWAALGVAVLLISDRLWPRVAPVLERMRARIANSSDGLLGRTGGIALGVLGGSAALAAIGVAVGLAGGDIMEWLVDHRGDVATFVIAAVISAILLLISSVGRRLERWVRRVARTAGLGVRSFATLLSMILLGPALAWPLFRLLGYSGRSTYALTLASAPLFGVVWVPFYAFGVWGVLQNLI